MYYLLDVNNKNSNIDLCLFFIYYYETFAYIRLYANAHTHLLELFMYNKTGYLLL